MEIKRTHITLHITLVALFILQVLFQMGWGIATPIMLSVQQSAYFGNSSVGIALEAVLGILPTVLIGGYLVYALIKKKRYAYHTVLVLALFSLLSLASGFRSVTSIVNWNNLIVLFLSLNIAGLAFTLFRNGKVERIEGDKLA